MKTKELLAPAGDMESLRQAIHNGADAVYLAGKKFGAREYAPNFTKKELPEAIKYCHLYDVKIYVTVNTIIYEKELPEALEFIEFLYLNQVDAIIVQDLGLIKIVRKKYPNLEIHASTQLNTHNLSQIKVLEKLGVKRVVLARELSLSEIKKLKTKMEIEVFIHGALCVCYSGQCLFSSLLMNRSGNRGSCAQLCRLSYKLLQDNEEVSTSGKYLLSPKELNTAIYFEELLNSNITSFKIEGRMKSPEYVGCVTKLYREIMDNILKYHVPSFHSQNYEDVERMFNRDFTSGHLFNVGSNKYMNITSSNHQGKRLGSVIQVTKDKIKILLEDELNQEDGIRFQNEDKGFIVNYLYDKDQKLVNHVDSDKIAYVDNKIALKSKGIVLKTIDKKLINRLKDYPLKKIAVDFKIKAHLNDLLTITITDGINIITKEGSIVNKAINQPTTEDIIIKKLGSLGNTPFEASNYDIDIDSNIFINMSELKELKHQLVSKLINEREQKIIRDTIIDNTKVLPDQRKIKANINITALVRTKDQLEACLKKNLDAIYVDNKELYENYKNKENVYLRLSRIMKNYEPLSNQKLLIGEIGALNEYSKNNELVSDYFLNVVNSENIKFLEENNVKRITLSIENNLENIKEITKNVHADLEMVIYGLPEVMIMKYCPLNYLINHNKGVCKVCQDQHEYSLLDSYHHKYPLLNEKSNHLTHIFYYQELDYISKIDDYIKVGVRNFRCDFFKESKEEVENILDKLISVKNSKVKDN